MIQKQTAAFRRPLRVCVGSRCERIGKQVGFAALTATLRVHLAPYGATRAAFAGRVPTRLTCYGLEASALEGAAAAAAATTTTATARRTFADVEDGAILTLVQVVIVRGVKHDAIAMVGVENNERRCIR
jgi:hypothetical protein